MSQESQRALSRIPEFATRQEEAEFWDTHDFTDYWDELEPVEVKFSDDLSSCITIPLDSNSLTEVFNLADKKGVSPASLIRSWILERLNRANATSSIG